MGATPVLRAVTVTLLAAALILLPGGPSGAPAAAHPGGRVVHALPPVADPGAEVAVGGSSLWSDAEVAIALVRGGTRPVALGTALTAGDGTLATRVRLPDGLPGGAWTLVVTHASGEAAEAPLTVRDGPLPMLALVVAALLALGLLAVPLLRRPRRAPAPSAPVSRP